MTGAAGLWLSGPADPVAATADTGGQPPLPPASHCRVPAVLVEAGRCHQFGRQSPLSVWSTASNPAGRRPSLLAAPGSRTALQSADGYSHPAVPSLTPPPVSRRAVHVPPGGVSAPLPLPQAAVGTAARGPHAYLRRPAALQLRVGTEAEESGTGGSRCRISYFSTTFVLFYYIFTFLLVGRRLQVVSHKLMGP